MPGRRLKNVMAPAPAANSEQTQRQGARCSDETPDVVVIGVRRALDIRGAARHDAVGLIEEPAAFAREHPQVRAGPGGGAGNRDPVHITRGI